MEVYMNTTDKLSMSARYLLTYIRYKTQHGYPFFQSNEAIAKVIGHTTSSTKVLVNKLIRQGYLLRTIDDKKRRNLSLSGKEYLPLDGVNMSNVEKNLLKEDAKNQRSWADYQQQEAKGMEYKVQQVEAERNYWKSILEKVVTALEHRGITAKMVEEWIAELDRPQATAIQPIKTASEQSEQITIRTPTPTREEQLDIFPESPCSQEAINQPLPIVNVRTDTEGLVKAKKEIDAYSREMLENLGIRLD